MRGNTFSQVSWCCRGVDGGNKFQILRPSLGLKLFEVEYQVSVLDLSKEVRSKLLKTQSGSSVALILPGMSIFLVDPSSGERLCSSQPQLDRATGSPAPPPLHLCPHVFLRPLYDHHKHLCKGNSKLVTGTVWTVQRNICASVNESEVLTVRTWTFCVVHQHELSVLERAASRGK